MFATCLLKIFVRERERKKTINNTWRAQEIKRYKMYVTPIGLRIYLSYVSLFLSLSRSLLFDKYFFVLCALIFNVYISEACQTYFIF